MKTSILSGFFLTSIFFLNCNNSKKERFTKDNIAQDTPNINVIQNPKKASLVSKIPIKLTWADSIIINYINHSNNELIKSTRKSNLTEQWMLDTQNRNGRTFIIAEIGRDNEYRFVPDAWIYIDSLTRNVFEYDVANDTILKWKR